MAAALELIAANARVADIGTGCGAVALAVAAARPEAQVLATDVDAACVALCERNAARLGLRVETAVADLLRACRGASMSSSASALRRRGGSALAAG